ncbi:MAG: cytochrome c [Bradyrhizobium sp.]|jgi:mono/diheme cytochrome c family protein
MKRSTLVLLTGLAGLMAGVCSSGLIEASAKPISYALPNETATFRPGRNLETVQDNCTACHSADYVQIQPRGAKFKEDFWRAEVTKMIKVYGASIDEADIGKIVDYLAQTY